MASSALLGGLRRVATSWTARRALQLASSEAATPQREQQEPPRAGPTTARLEVHDPLEPATGRPAAPLAAYRALELDGAPSSGAAPESLALSGAQLVAMYRTMLALNTMDRILFDSQRQGRITFYITSFGEEAAQVGSAAALEPQDWIFAQYREQGALLQRGAGVRFLVDQCFGNVGDPGKGRQMPVHYGNRALNFVTLSSPLATQMPQAVGAAFALGARASASGQRAPAVMCYFGEGAASEGDAHAALNFAATLAAPVIFFCRNNQFAISTPATDQFRGDGIASRAAGYGIASVRVDGNDLVAVYEATREARRFALHHKRPVLLEAMTYRVGHHSTSDDSSAYRPAEEVRAWSQHDDPVARVRRHLEARHLWSGELEREARAQARADVIEALTEAGRARKHPLESMFDDVYAELPANLVKQRRALREHLQQFGDQYPADH